MGDHTHEKGEWMVSYRYMRMGMNGNRDNDERISSRRVLQDFMVAPTSMDMDMHMFSVMYAPIDRVTLMVMLPYVDIEMDHKTRVGARFTTRSDGIGDFKTTALVELWKTHGHQVHANLGLSWPTGSITRQDKTPMSGGNKVRIPYPMQIGSGTYDFLPGLTYTGHADRFNWGGQARGEVRLNENHADYTLGNEYALTAWGGVELLPWLSTSIRFEWQHWMNIRGSDPSLNRNVVPTADPGRRSGKRLDALLGLNLIATGGAVKGLRLAVEAGLPTYQHLDGPQLETDWMATAGLQYAF